jgi:PKD repeat protein
VLLTHPLFAGVKILHQNESMLEDTCIARFDYVQNINNPLTIQFSDYSMGLASFWDWDFGDGSHSTQQNPLHQFPDSGTYVVCLTISSPVKECFDTYCDTVTVPVPSDCFTPFTYFQVPEDPFELFFTAQPGPDIESLSWDFGDGAHSDELAPFHAYQDTGTYIVTLTATNHHNPVYCHSVVYDTIIVRTDECISMFTFQPTLGYPLQIKFTSLAQGSFNSMFWDFGDGRTSNEMNPVHLYADTGTFNVCLTIGNFNFPEFCQDVFCQEVKIQLINCQSLFDYVTDSLLPLKVSFINQSIGIANQYIWKFGDGTNSEEYNPQHKYSAPGNYEVCLSVSNNLFPEYCNDSICQMVNVELTECAVNFDWQTDSLRPLEVQFNSSIIGNPDKIVWDFGDGSLDDGPNPFHVFSDTGNYQVTVTVTNSNYMEFCNASQTKNVQLAIKHKPNPDFVWVFDSLTTTPNKFNFIDKSQGNDIRQWKWSFGDGLYSSEQNPEHQFEQALTYNVCLTVTDFLPPKYTVTAKVCKPLSTFTYFDIGGSIFDSDFPINNPSNKGDTARVYIYRLYTDDNIVPIDTGTFYQLGYYWFSQMLSNEYIIKAELTENSKQFGKFFPTYATRSAFWQASDPITLNSNVFNVDVHLLEKPIYPTGNGRVAGLVLKVPNQYAQTGEPMANAKVFLATSKHELIDYTTSDSTGKFAFNGLAFGEYMLIPDVTGYYYQTDTASISVSKPDFTTGLIKLWQNFIVQGLDPKNGQPSVRIAPNPVGDILHLSIDSPLTGAYKVELFNASGQLIFVQESTMTNTTNAIQIPVRHLPQSVYLLRFISNEGINALTFIKK